MGHFFFFKTIVSCRELWLRGETVGTRVAALKMAVNGVFEDFYVLLKCVFIGHYYMYQKF